MKVYRTPTEEADRLKISLRTMRDLIARRQFPVYRVGHKLLLVADEVDEAIAASRQRAYTEPKRPAGRLAALNPN